MFAVGHQPQAFGHFEPRCAQQLGEIQPSHTECEIDRWIGVEFAQRERA